MKRGDRLKGKNKIFGIILAVILTVSMVISIIVPFVD